MHTDGDYPEVGRIRVENVERATELYSGISITKELVDFEAEYLRSVTEKYSDKTAKIYIRSNQPIEWQKYSAIKEYSHILYDDPSEDCETNPLKTLSFLTSNDPFQLDGGHTPSELSEKITEILALEIIYPIEWRPKDRKFLDEGGAISDLVEKRHVPAVHIQRGCSDGAMATSAMLWKLLNDKN
tara:strand:- start:1554 stop:2108 length:555 start_codon:yes stop_codon:yes gene_type:complete